MVTLILITTPIVVLGAFMIGHSSRTRWKRFICQIAVGIVLLFGSFCFLSFTIMRNISVETSNSIKVATIETNINIYQDIDSEEYFRLIQDKWNIFDMYDREYIDATDAEKIIEVSEIISDWDN